MKKNILNIIALAVVMIFVSAIGSNNETPINSALVDQEQGLFIFVRSQPVKKYKFLGKVNMPEVTLTGKPREMMNVAVKRAARQYEKANAIIIHSDNFTKVDAILLED